jgi:hypothetical protein
VLAATIACGIVFALIRHYQSRQPSSVARAYLAAVDSGDTQRVATYFPVSKQISSELNTEYSAIHLNYVIPSEHRDIVGTYTSGNLAAVLFAPSSPTQDSKCHAVLLLRRDQEWRILQNAPEALDHFWRVEHELKPQDVSNVMNWVASRAAHNRIQ